MSSIQDLFRHAKPTSLAIDVAAAEPSLEAHPLHLAVGAPLADDLVELDRAAAGIVVRPRIVEFLLHAMVLKRPIVRRAGHCRRPCVHQPDGRARRIQQHHPAAIGCARQVRGARASGARYRPTVWLGCPLWRAIPAKVPRTPAVGKAIALTTKRWSGNIASGDSAKTIDPSPALAHPTAGPSTTARRPVNGSSGRSMSTLTDKALIASRLNRRTSCRYLGRVT